MPEKNYKEKPKQQHPLLNLPEND